MLAMAPSVFRHNRFSLTPVWCYRRGSDRLPYGVIRRVRDIQQDLNKRASKALFLLNTNQIIADEGAVADWDVARDEVSRPDGVVLKKPGKEFAIRRDTDAATGQISMMTLAAQSIQKSAGVSDENLGRRTNAVSGEAIKARQLQGSVVTTEPFDNLRFAVQVQGEKQLALTEQFYTEEKVVRLTGAKGALEWVKVNQPEVQADGTVRFINDITASMADFMVADADYAGTLRQVMFESLNAMAMRLPPEVALRLMAMAMDYSDLPNKDEIAREIRQITGQPDPSVEPTPEEAQQLAQQQQMQVEALQMQREQAMLALEEARAKVRELNARAAKLEAEAGAGSPDGQMQAAIDQVRAQAAQEIDRLSDALRKANAELAARTIQANKDADVAIERARIEAASRERVAEIQAGSDRAIDQLSRRLAELEQRMNTRPAAPA
jgi:ribosome-associated translation inhibitor RaiA